jgi:hypothetical protein
MACRWGELVAPRSEDLQKQGRGDDRDTVFSSIGTIMDAAA